MAKKQSNKNRPVEEIRIGGIKAAIWKNEAESGTWYNVSFQRLYRNEDGSWASSPTFSRNDLLLLAKVANAAHTRLMELAEADTASRRTAAA